MQIQRSLKKALKNPLSVTGLDLRQEKPILLFPEIEKFINLEFIDFSNCTTLNWADACTKLAKLPKLTTIKAFNADIQSLPNELGLLKTLTSIDFSDNENLKALPETFSELTKLEDITIYGSGLESLPQTPWNFPNLRTLSLGKNKLQLFPEEFFTGLPGLQAITISDNQLQSLPESICQLKNLTSLLAGNNLFHALPQNFAALTHLETLWLDSCPGINYEEELLKIIDLPIKSLTLLGNNLSELPRPFYDFKYLQVLNINSNNLTNSWVLIGQLCHLPLTELDVRFNGCETIAIENVQANIPTIQKVFFDNRTTNEFSEDVNRWVNMHFDPAVNM